MEQMQSNEIDTESHSFGYDASSPPHNETAETITISLDTYKKLIDDSILLLKANKTIDKLNQAISKKDEELKNGKQSSEMEHLSPVNYKNPQDDTF